ncbi:DUF6482 family protein [Vibrio ostreicida]|uniref:DUF6482 family protein n=1 Tax=Vibrio ostreicida TaxID=526588 RepID=A0ABT8BVU6_9VIBR|nr:DUF6482 family protein [Vibrio ostreicida]MDN3610917.1 DUF6482 family protein [Vibrio ostreicida]MDN3611218.1 DUF6482 family protein [Vibrio ostreicida]NPD10497.1 hypothetical protein [Vibrio ostreicida]
MHKKQLDKWIHGYHKEGYQPPKIFVIGCSDLPHYLLAVEYKHKLEPIRQDNQPIHFESLDTVKEALCHLGVERAYLRLHNTYDECGIGDVPLYHDVELSLTSH